MKHQSLQKRRFLSILTIAALSFGGISLLAAQSSCESGRCSPREFQFDRFSDFDRFQSFDCPEGCELDAAPTRFNRRMNFRFDARTMALIQYLQQEREIEDELLYVAHLLSRGGDEDGAETLRRIAKRHSERADEVLASLTDRNELGIELDESETPEFQPVEPREVPNLSPDQIQPKGSASRS